MPHKSRGEVLRDTVFCHTARLRNRPASLKIVLSDSAFRVARRIQAVADILDVIVREERGLFLKGAAPGGA